MSDGGFCAVGSHIGLFVCLWTRSQLKSYLATLITIIFLIGCIRMRLHADQHDEAASDDNNCRR